MLPLLVKATAFLTSLNQVIELGTTVFGVQTKRKPVRQNRRVTKTRLRKTPMEYQATGVELAMAFEAAFHHLNSPPIKKQTGMPKAFTIGDALRFSVGHDLRVVRCALSLISDRLEGKTASQWLIERGVPKEEVTGLKGMKGVRVWKAMWLKKLAEEFQGDSTVYKFTYPF